jgi:ribose transport system permease protein
MAQPVLDSARNASRANPPQRGRLRVSTTFKRQIAITAVAVVLFVFFSIAAQNFFELSNILNIGIYVAFTAIVGVGMTFLFIAGEFDISVGTNYGLGTIIFGLLVVNHSYNLWVAAIVVIAISGGIGLVNGLVTTVVGVPSFIVTLGMYSVLNGLALVLSGGFPITFPTTLHSTFIAVSSGTVLGIPAQVLWMAAALIIGGSVLKFTPFGYHVYAVGGNSRAARASGIRTERVKILCFIITGALCGLIAAIQTGWLQTSSPTTGPGFELQVIGAVIIGGVAIQGGEGNVYGTFIGAVILGMLDTGIVLMGVDGNYTELFIGVIIISAASVDVVIRGESKLATMLGASGVRRLRRTRHDDLPPDGGD